jgi:glycosyltransferase involved in cell wall biosynthesis
MRRRASGIERITAELFSDQALAPLHVKGTGASHRRLSLVLHQMVGNPLLASVRRHSVWVFPGYPPSPLFALMRERSVLYVHDLFLMTRKDDLNRAAKLYMAYPFRLAVRTLRYFLVNSLTTGRQLSASVSDGATILPYRPRVTNLFRLDHRPRDGMPVDRPVIVGAMGTIEPRKNFPAAARICQALAERLSRPVELHIIGRRGWGPDYDILGGSPGVRLLGFLPDEAIHPMIEQFDLFLCTSHDEGLGLPLLEMQYAGLPILAPDADVFREVLGESGNFIDPGDAVASAAAIAGWVRTDGWFGRAAELARANLKRWNAQAAEDRAEVVALLRRLASPHAATRLEAPIYSRRSIGRSSARPREKLHRSGS